MTVRRTDRSLGFTGTLGEICTDADDPAAEQARRSDSEPEDVRAQEPRDKQERSQRRKRELRAFLAGQQ